jgi:hypothetical protein
MRFAPGEEPWRVKRNVQSSVLSAAAIVAREPWRTDDAQ